MFKKKYSTILNKFPNDEWYQWRSAIGAKNSACLLYFLNLKKTTALLELFNLNLDQAKHKLPLPDFKI